MAVTQEKRVLVPGSFVSPCLSLSSFTIPGGRLPVAGCTVVMKGADEQGFSRSG